MKTIKTFKAFKTVKAPFSFMNTPEEWHAFVLGWAETACPWWARYRCTKQAEYTPEKEYHYYVFGRVIGFLTLITIIIITTIIIIITKAVF